MGDALYNGRKRAALQALGQRLALDPGLEPGTPGSPEESFATRLFTPEEGKSMEPHA
jgi:hypothetical protein